MRTGFEVRACTVSSPHIRKKIHFIIKLIRVIRIFMRKIFVVQCGPQKIFVVHKIFLTSNYFWTTVLQYIDIYSIYLPGYCKKTLQNLTKSINTKWIVAYLTRHKVFIILNIEMCNEKLYIYTKPTVQIY